MCAYLRAIARRLQASIKIAIESHSCGWLRATSNSKPSRINAWRTPMDENDDRELEEDIYVKPRLINNPL